MVLNANNLFMATVADVQSIQSAHGASCLGDVLTPVQCEWLETYRQEHKGKLIFDLSQNPGEDGRPRCSLVDGAAPCFTTNSGRLWFFQQDLNVFCSCSFAGLAFFARVRLSLGIMNHGFDRQVG